jgi:hypothetical protein
MRGGKATPHYLLSRPPRRCPSSGERGAYASGAHHPPNLDPMSHVLPPSGMHRRNKPGNWPCRGSELYNPARRHRWHMELDARECMWWWRCSARSHSPWEGAQGRRGAQFQSREPGPRGNAPTGTPPSPPLQPQAWDAHRHARQSPLCLLI